MASSDEYFEHHAYMTYFSFTRKKDDIDDIGRHLMRIAYFSNCSQSGNNVTIEHHHGKDGKDRKLKLSVIIRNGKDFGAILSSPEPLDSDIENFFKNYLQSDFSEISQFIMSSSK